MSGDVQPRKRKDNKKKRKEDGDGLLTTSLSSSSNNEDTQTIIHVHKDGGTGGNICAKIVFFLLFSALIVLIGLIIKENQGLNELENVDSSESRFSQIFEGWTDKTVDEHDDHHHASPEELSDELHDDDDDDDDLHEEEEEESEENANTAEEDHSEEVSEEAQNEEESNEIEEEETSQTEEDDEESDEEEVELSEEKNDDESQQQDEQEAEEDQDEEIKENDEDSVEQIENKKDSDEINQEDKKLKKPSSSIAEEPSSTKESSGLTTKIGVGLSLLIVAYKVFFRKRRTDNAVENSTKMVQQAKDSSSALDLMNRRNTIIPPPSLQEIEQDLPEADVNNDDEEYSEEDNDDDEEKDQHEGVHHFTPKEEYQELRKTYTRSLTPEGEFEPGIKRFEDDEENAEEADIDEEEDENDNYDEDEELLKRLEAKYGKLGRDVNVVEEQEEQHEIRISDDSEKDDDDDYEHADITNVDDYLIKDEIDTANQHLINKNVAYANKLFETLLEKYPQSPRIIYGKGLVLDKLADQEKSNELLNKALNYYLQALNAPNVPDKLFMNIAERFIDRAHFLGQYKKAIGVHWNLIERFPDNSIFYNRLAVTYLTINLAEEARMVLQKVLTKWPNNGFALVHYGFILKTVDNKLEKSIEFMSKGLKSREKGVIDGRFYFHLGDALARLNRNKEAEQLYTEGVKEKVFKSIYQRSLYNVDRLTARSWWKLEDIPQYRSLFSELINNYGKIREEGLNVLNTKGYFKDEAENLKDTGEWKQFELFARGQKSVKNCNKSPVTCSIIEKFSYASACKRGQTKFSVMHPGTHVWPHCGPTNCRLRIHLGLKVPANTFIRVAKEIRSWKDGDLLIFDDSFEHEVWHNGSEFRLVLIVDVWHPELTPTEKRSLSPI